MTVASALCLHDYEALARRRLPRPLFGYIAGACEDNWSHDENRAALCRLALRPRILRDTAARTTSIELFGDTWAAPFGIAPMGLSALMAYRGDVALARAAADEQIPMIVSGASLIPLEDIAQAAPTAWFQAYLPAETERIDAMLARVERAGFKTLVLTVDVPVTANRENLLRVGFSTPLRPSLRLALEGLTHPRWLFGVFGRTLLHHGLPHFENMRHVRGEPILSRHVERDFGQRERLSWDSLAYMRQRWPGRLIVKGILHPDDARLAREHGADGLIVSNHGGRQLDGVCAALEALPAVIDAVGELPVMIDSGFRRGSDVLKALALGARLVFIGRPFLYAAAVGGEKEVQRAAQLLKAEIHRNMAMLGVTELAQLNRDYLLR